MDEIRRSSDGKRLFSREFKRAQVARVLRDEITFKGLADELKIDVKTARSWLAGFRRDEILGESPKESVGPALDAQCATARVRELEQLVIAMARERFLSDPREGPNR